MRDELFSLLDDYRASALTGPVNVEGLCSALGLHVETTTGLPGIISGHIDARGNQSVARIAAGEHPYRRRFTLAHLLGHHVLHRSTVAAAGGTNDNHAYRTDQRAPFFNPHIDEAFERQANSFAANLLMPKEAVQELAKRYGAGSDDGVPLARLCEHLHVSPSAMAWRMRQMGISVRG